MKQEREKGKQNWSRRSENEEINEMQQMGNLKRSNHGGAEKTNWISKANLLVSKLY